MPLVIELIVVLWLAALGFSVYYFVKSLNEAIAKGHEPKAEEQVAKFTSHPITSRHLLPTGHQGRRPAH